MSPFLVYLVFQADSFVALFFVLASCLAVISIVVGMYAGMEESAFAASWFKKTAIAATIFTSLGALIPSTSTVAAMVVLPKITNPQALNAMGSEAKDLYALAKRALTKLTDDKPQDVKK